VRTRDACTLARYAYRGHKMSPNGQIRATKLVPGSNLYTIILALAFAVVLATAAFVAYKCYFDYGTLFEIP